MVLQTSKKCWAGSGLRPLTGMVRITDDSIRCGESSRPLTGMVRTCQGYEPAGFGFSPPYGDGTTKYITEYRKMEELNA